MSLSLFPRNHGQPKGDGRTPGTGDTCTYVYCKAPGGGELWGHYYQNQNNGIPWTLCSEHVKPEFHPPDLHGKLRKW